MEKILTLAVKDLRLLVRDRAGFFFTFFFPLMISILFGTIFSGGAENYAVSVAVVDEDGSPEAADFIATLASTPGINALATSREEAAESVRRGKRAAYIVVLPGFGEASQNMFRGNPPAVEMGIDPAHTADGAMLEGIMMRTGARRFERLFEAAGGGHNAFEPVSINKVDVSVNRKWPKNAYARPPSAYPL
jgi:ABC-2 type transport system permease protein